MPLTPPDFWYRPAGVLSTLLAPLSGITAAAGRLRRAGVTPVQAGVPVICAGNVTAGGAGKTPLALDIAARLSAAGIEAHFLTRGYGGREHGPVRVEPRLHTATEVGDEPLLLAEAAPTWVSADRPAGARAAVAAGARAIVMDDGFQNPSLAKDLSILAVDGEAGLGNGRVMPAGPLREPADAAFARAQAVAVIGGGKINIALPAGLPRLAAHLVPGPEIETFRRMPLVAFAGIARPAKFFATLREAGCEIAEARGFADHHMFAAAELASLSARAGALGATLVTTAKDYVRIPAARREGIRCLTVSLAWENEAALDALLAPIAAAAGGGG